jgi:hypothetical protein
VRKRVVGWAESSRPTISVFLVEVGYKKLFSDNGFP